MQRRWQKLQESKNSNSCRSNNQLLNHNLARGCCCENCCTILQVTQLISFTTNYHNLTAEKKNLILLYNKLAQSYSWKEKFDFALQQIGTILQLKIKIRFCFTTNWHNLTAGKKKLILLYNKLAQSNSWKEKMDFSLQQIDTISGEILVCHNIKNRLFKG